MLGLVVKLTIDGADRVPMMEVEGAVIAHLEGSSITVKDEDGSRRSIVIDEVTTGDFTVED